MSLKKLLKIFAWFILGFITFAAAYFAAALALPLISIKAEPAQNSSIPIYIATNGDHTDIIVPVRNSVKDWTQEISYQNTISKDTTGKNLAIGWGDKGFYLNTPTWSQLKFSVAFKAAFGLSSSALHCTFYKQLRESADCKKIMLNDAQYTRLVKYIDSSLKRDNYGHVINIKTNANYDNEDAFYEAKRTYSLFYTCNTWANNALKASGQKACLWTPFDMGIFRLYNK